MKNTVVDTLLGYAQERYPQFLKGINESIRRQPDRFHEIATRYLEWAQTARGADAIERAVDAYVGFTTDVNLAQARYESVGHYAHRSFAEVYQSHYSQREQMDDYLWGVYLTNFLWAHHLDITLFFEDRFLAHLPPQVALVEIAPGHGGWGVSALHHLQQAHLTGYDISPSSISIASAIAEAANVKGRASYHECDALQLDSSAGGVCDALICCFLVEHLETPERLFKVIAHLLRPGGKAFVTGALTAAQIDHIYEIQHESELMVMAESAGLRAVESLSVNPDRLLPRARFVPRSMALLLTK